MKREGEGERWLEQAKEDLHWAELLLESGGYHLVCFLAQQIAERALKGFLYHTGEESVLGHSVAWLAAQAAERLPILESRTHDWSSLDGYYVTTRYPNSLPGSIPSRVYGRKSAEEAIRLARDVVTAVETHWGKL